MFDDQAFQQDKLIVELKESNIVMRGPTDTSVPVGFALVNHSRNNNVKVQIKPNRKRPVLPEFINQNPSAYIDDNRGFFGTCLRHAENYVIVCDDATNELHLNTSLGQTIVDLTRNNTNIVQIFINDVEYQVSDFILNYGTTRTFNSAIFESYDIIYEDIPGNNRLSVIGATEVRVEVRVKPNTDIANDLPVDMVKQIFTEVAVEPNPSLIYHSNEKFYGFTVCLKSNNLDSKLNVRLANQFELLEMMQAGAIQTANLEGTAVDLSTVSADESTLSVQFEARLLNDFDEPLGIRTHHYLLDLGIPEIAVPLASMRVRFSRYTLEGALIGEANQTFPASALYSSPNGNILLADVVNDDFENTNEYYVEYTVDFDGDEELYLPYTHRLNVRLSRFADVVIPVMTNFAVSFPRMLTTFTNAVFQTHQYYQFGVNVEANSVLTVWSKDLGYQAVEYSIVNGANGVLQQHNMNIAESRSGSAWYFEEAEFVVVQLKLPIGLTGEIDLLQQRLDDPFYGTKRLSTGKLDNTDVSNRFAYYSYKNINNVDTLVWFNPMVEISRDIGRIVQLIDEVSIGQAITIMGQNDVLLAQDISGLADYDPYRLRIAPNKSVTHKVLQLRSEEFGATNAWVLEFLENQIRVHAYLLDDNYVPTTYYGNYIVDFVYDGNKPISIVGAFNSYIAHIGTAYDVNEGDIGPIGSDLVTVQETELQLINMIEVPL